MKTMALAMNIVLLLLLHGTEVEAQKAGYALQFDGVNDYVATSLNIDQSGASAGMTMEAWVYPTSASGGRHQVISSDDGGFDWSLLREGGQWYVFTGENSRRTDFAVELNTWQRVVAVFIPDTGVKFYKNGQSVTIPHIGYDASDNNIAFGRNPGPWGEFFQGLIDEVRLWDVVRTESQIHGNMNRRLSGNEEGLIGYWRFDEASGDTARDYSKGGNHGILINEPGWVASTAPIKGDAAPWTSTDCTAENQLTFEWNAISGASAYRLDIASDTTAGSIIAVVEVGDTTSYSYAGNLVEGTRYFARVAYSKDGGTNYEPPSPFSDGIVIDRTPPVADKPTGQFLNDRDVQFQFTGSDNEFITNYHVQIAADVSFSNPVVEATISAEGIFTYRGNHGQTVYARAYAIDCAGNQSAYSEASDGVYIPLPSKGLLGEYYDGYFADNFSFFENNTPVLVRVDSVINFADRNESWDLFGTPIADRETYSVRWTGYIDIPVTGNYTFYTISDDASYVFFDEAAHSPNIDNATVNNGGLHPGRERSGTIFLPAGFHPVLVLFGENNLFDHMSFSWESADGDIPKQIVPSSVLRVSVENLPPSDGGDCTANQITFSWSPVSGANAYRLDIATDTTEASIIDMVEVGNVLSFVYDTNLIEGFRYHARVAASVDGGATYQDPSPFSDGIVIDRTPPIANTPTGQLLDDHKVQFLFSGSDNVSLTSYHIQIATDLGFGAPIIDETISAEGIFTLTGMPGQTLYARAYAIDCAGNQSPYSEASNAVLIPPLPDLEVTQVQVPPVAWSGQSFEVTWVVTNRGEGSTNVPEWLDGVYLSPISTFDPDVATALGSFPNVSYLNPGEGYTNTVSLTLPQGITGSYYVFVVTDFKDNLPESNGSNNVGRNATAMQVNLTPPPDLRVISLIAPDNAFSGQSIEVSWSVKNLGSGSTQEDEWFDAIYVSQDSILNLESATQLGVFKHQGLLASDSIYSQSATVKLPHAIFGAYYLFVVTDATQSVFEHVWENNNTQYRGLTITLTPPPDLVVTNLVIPTAASSGEEITVGWTVQNQGAGAPFESGWSDRVYLSVKSTFHPDSATALGVFSGSGPLEPDSSYTLQRQVRLPNGISGAYYIFVKTDWDNQVFEHLFEDNNVRRSHTTIAISLSPWPDLQVTTIQAPGQATAGEQISPTWTVTNAGKAKASAAFWLDRIYVSSSATWNPSVAMQLNEVPRSQPLDTSASYTQTSTVTLPPDLSGIYYLYVYTDVTNSVFEHTDEGNNVGRSGAIDVQPYPPVDLAVTRLSASASGFSGRPLSVEWTVENLGSAATLVSSWHDGIYLSRDTLLNTSQDLLLEKIRRVGALAAAESYSRNFDVTLPNGSSGEYYLFIKTDVDNRVKDSNPNNNVKHAPAPISIELSSSPDLQITSFDAPTEAQSGQPITVQWTVQNTGEASTFATTWYDAIYLSSDSRLDHTDRRLGLFTRQGALQPSASYSGSLEVDLPLFASGAYYLILKTDSRDDAYEHGAEGNNKQAQLIILTLPPPADLVVTKVSLPNSAVSGEEVTISWTVRNQGANPAVGWLRDAVYISADSTWEVSDPLLGIARRHINLSPGASMPVSFKVNLTKAVLADSVGNITDEMPGVTPGPYHAIVRTDIRNNIRESDDTNNTLASTATMAVDIPVLQLGVPTTGILSQGQMKYYRVEVGANLDLRLTLTSDVSAAVNEVYVAYNRIPTLNDFDHSAAAPFSSNQQVVVPSTQSGSYYLLVLARSLPGGIASEAYSLIAEALSFSISGIVPNAGGSGGRVTCRMFGAGFRQGTTVYLRVSPDSLLAGKVIKFISTTELRIRWDLSHVALGTYDVVAINPDGARAELLNGFVVEPLRDLRVGYTHTVPEVIFFGGTGVFTFHYQNTSNVDIPYLIVLIHLPLGTELEVSCDRFLTRQSLVQAVLDSIGGVNNYFDSGDKRIVPLIARDVAVGEVIQCTIVVRNVTGTEFPMEVSIHVVDRDAFLHAQISMIETLRQFILQNPEDFDPQLVAFAADSAAFTNDILKTLAELGLLEPVDLVGLTFKAIDHYYGCWFAFLDCLIPLPPPLNIALCAVGLSASCLLPFTGTDPGILGCLGLFSAAYCGIRLPFVTGIVRPIDPNDMIGPPGFGDEKWIAKNATLPYTIRFENDSTQATAPAQVVTIAQQLDTTLDARTFRLGRFGFGNFIFEVPENRSFYSQRLNVRDSLALFVDVNAGIDVTTNTAFWIFKSVDPATGELPTNPLSGFLLVNDAAGRGQGFVSYTIRPKSTVRTRDVVNAEAGIIFDNNEPIDTPPIFNTIDAGPPASRVFPLPDRIDTTAFVVSWSGQDDPNGSGLRNFELYVAKDEESFDLHQSGLQDTSLVFIGEFGHTYHFFTVATDNAGNVEPMKSEAEATITLDSTFTSVTDAASNLPRQFALHQNYPNPFNPNTKIRYDLPKPAKVELAIFNLLGQKVRTLVDEEQIAGFHSIRWDSRNDQGAPVASGVYLYRIRTSEFAQTKKMLLLR